jgi:hypothetical protein
MRNVGSQKAVMLPVVECMFYFDKLTMKVEICFVNMLYSRIGRDRRRAY